mmetsp:Transcript_18766/g.32268  ORF Transcript_18766/g.32268 Transcript_18766/m.32268 type:complete len:301 (-) Transcript_18766:226-1128(-)
MQVVKKLFSTLGFLSLSTFSTVVANPGLHHYNAIIHEPKKALAPPVSFVTKIPRGGAGPLNPDTTAKVFVGLLGFQAANAMLAPEMCLKSYCHTPDAFSTFLIETNGAVGCTAALLLGLQLFKGMSFEKAIGWSVLPYVVIELKKAFTKQGGAIGFPSANHYPSVILNLVVMCASLTDEGFASGLNKFYGIWSLINGLPMLIVPEKAGKAWGLEPKTDVGKVVMSNLGLFLIAHGMAVSVPAFGLLDGDALMNSIGGAAAAVGASILFSILVKKFDMGYKPLAYGWALFSLIVAGTLLIT